MKQFRFDYHDPEEIANQLTAFKKEYTSEQFSRMVFQIYSEVLEPDVIGQVCGVLDRIFPETPYMGCSTSGNIIDCQLSHKITVVCTIFELPSTQFRLFQYDMSKDSVDHITACIVEEVNNNLWVKAIEMFFTIPEGSTTHFCDGLKNIRYDVQIFGGVACSDDITSDESCVFSKEGGFSNASNF